MCGRPRGAPPRPPLVHHARASCGGAPTECSESAELFFSWSGVGPTLFRHSSIKYTVHALIIYTHLILVLAVHGHRVRRLRPHQELGPTTCVSAGAPPPSHALLPDPSSLQPALAPCLPLRSADQHPTTQPRNPAGAPTCPDAVTAYRPDDGQARSLPPRACCLRVLMWGRTACRGLLAADNARCGAHEGAHAVGQEAGARERGREGNAPSSPPPPIQSATMTVRRRRGSPPLPGFPLRRWEVHPAPTLSMLAALRPVVAPSPQYVAGRTSVLLTACRLSTALRLLASTHCSSRRPPSAAAVVPPTRWHTCLFFRCPHRLYQPLPCTGSRVAVLQGPALFLLFLSFSLSHHHGGRRTPGPPVDGIGGRPMGGGHHPGGGGGGGVCHRRCGRPPPRPCRRPRRVRGNPHLCVCLPAGGPCRRA